ncbi:MAG: inorganic diphosphatase, partial [Planctomycetota bacterium]
MQLSLATSILCLLLTACSSHSANEAEDARSLAGAANFWTGYPATVGEMVNVVVEIPAGTNSKWEVDKSDGVLRWEIKEGEPRVVQYLAYPANYGMIPATLLPKEMGGDGDPLDVLLLGPAQARGSIVQAHLLGVLELLDGGERDDKLIALAADAPMHGVTS